VSLFQPVKSVKIVYLGGKMKTTTQPAATVTAQAPAQPVINEEANRVFQTSDIPSLMSLAPPEVSVKPEDVTENICLRRGCQGSIFQTPFRPKSFLTIFYISIFNIKFH
jgi:hypothetical protein